jgi:hypothetical protein
MMMMQRVPIYRYWTPSERARARLQHLILEFIIKLRRLGENTRISYYEYSK